jgi:hypothetical protein
MQVKKSDSLDDREDDVFMVEKSDPTALTTKAIFREIASLKEIVFTRLNAMDKAISLFNENITRVPTDTDKQISHLRELVLSKLECEHELKEEKFRKVDQRFNMILDSQTVQKNDAHIAVMTALESAKELVSEQNKASAMAITKSEIATNKAIEQQSLLIQTSTKLIEDKIGDIKDRLTKIEGEGTGKRSSRDDLMAILALLVAVGAVLLNLFLK